jgi:hypothetical protein
VCHELVIQSRLHLNVGKAYVASIYEKVMEPVCSPKKKSKRAEIKHHEIGGARISGRDKVDLSKQSSINGRVVRFRTLSASNLAICPTNVPENGVPTPHRRLNSLDS